MSKTVFRLIKHQKITILCDKKTLHYYKRCRGVKLRSLTLKPMNALMKITRVHSYRALHEISVNPMTCRTTYFYFTPFETSPPEKIFNRNKKSDLLDIYNRATEIECIAEDEDEILEPYIQELYPVKMGDVWGYTTGSDVLDTNKFHYYYPLLQLRFKSCTKFQDRCAVVQSLSGRMYLITDTGVIKTDLTPYLKTHLIIFCE